ncbi:MAG TPA: tetratricopeptide repeat-containing glycosyltransferase family protein [Alphaproteobacteria bacterium]|nr:tetratricopeptide repeat-containing glycosyltransferase family protein [Alphaproteobacteria bacterium]
MPRNTNQRPQQGLPPSNIRRALTQAGNLQAQGRFEEAAAIYRRVVAAAPSLPQAHFALATAYEDLGALDQAAASFRVVLDLDPNSYAAWVNLGACQEDLGEMAAAEASFERAIALRPNMPEGWFNLAHVHAAGGEHARAISSLERAIALAPDRPQIHLNLGNSLWKLGRLEEAINSFRRAVELKFENADVYLGLAASLKVMGRIDEAIAALDRATILEPENPQLRFQRALVLLLDGQWDKGWAEYEWRWKDPTFPSPRRNYPVPLWDGGSLRGRRILLHWEQGFGDTIQFIRFAALVKARGATVLAELQPPLCRLFQHVDGIDEIIPSGSPLPPFDCHAPLMSLPRILGLRPANIPASDGYLRPDPARVRRWTTKLGPMSGLRVGICWQGAPAQVDNRFRSIPPAELGPLLALPGISWVSLQKGLSTDGLREIGLGDFADTAAVISNLDLVITVCTSVAHVAGALGKPTWVLVHAGPDWRWLRSGERSAWYSSVRLFRQKTLGAWGGVLREVIEALAAAVSSKSATL